MSLFSRLLKLHGGIIPLEDFFTELVAHLFSTNKEIHAHGRYLMYARIPDKWWCGLGFRLNTSSSTDYPIVYLTLELDPSSPRRAAIIEAMNKICKQPEWKGYELDDSRAWSRIVFGRSLQSFLGEEDQVAAIQKFFLETLDAGGHCPPYTIANREE